MTNVRPMYMKIRKTVQKNISQYNAIVNAIVKVN